MKVSKAWMVPIVGLGAWLTLSGHAAAQTAVSCTLSGTPPNISLTCGSGSTGSTGAPNCSLVQISWNQTSTGGTASLTASCDAGATSYSWRSAGGQVTTTTSSNTNTGTLPDNSAGASGVPVTFYVKACSASGCGAEASQTVTVPAGSNTGGGGGQTGAGLCGNYANVSNVNMASWNAGFTSAMVRGGVLVIPFTPGVGNPQINWANFSGSPLTRTVTVSRSACDFRKTLDPSGANGPVAGRQSGIGSVYPVLTPGVQYYLNIADMMWSTGLPVCAAGSDCGDVIVTIR